MSLFAAYCSQVSRNMTLLGPLSAPVGEATALAINALRAGKKVMFCGNGGSAADSQHLAAELMGRFLIDRRPLAALALTVDTSALTAIANDYTYDDVFSRQLRGIGSAGDVLIGLSTSGTSRNVLSAFAAAKDMGIGTIGLTGEGGGDFPAACDVAICVPASQTNHIQEMHIVIGHFICSEIERALCHSDKP